ncbi:hypothetical protein L1887_38630 [Cichorium endivia]|nr:hypothetical protein L1887_38630 [Cichorium endivia]
MKEDSPKDLEKSYFDVLGLCCSSEVSLIEKILKPLEGVHHVSVIVPSRTVIVLHDAALISQLQIVKALNQARLEANVRMKGVQSYGNKWPSPYAVVCGVLLLLSFLKYVYSPFKWLALGAVAVGIVPLILKAIASLRIFRLDINVLMLIAVGGSIFLKDYWEAGTIVFLLVISEWLEARASHKATAVMSSLMSIAPQKAILADTGEEVNANEVKVNTRLAVKAGTMIPIDGIVVEGTCEVDEKTLTGESFPVVKQVDSIVYAGTLNLNGYISVKTTALAEACVVARMAKLVEEAQNNKSKTQRYVDECAKYYTPAVCVVAACLAAIPAAMRAHNLQKWYHLALVVLVSACPCALILSTPIAAFCALSKAATSGLLVKGAEYLEILSTVKFICFDKTGTITRGEFSVSSFQPLIDSDKLLYWVSSIESKSSHPMAAALVDYAQSRSVEPQPDNVEEFKDFPGEGIFGKIDGNDVYIGNQKIGVRAGCSQVPIESSNEGRSTGYIFLGSSCAGIFSLSDSCRIGVKEALEELKSMGIKTAMLTGDSQEAANYAQNQVMGALDIIHAGLLPQDKAKIIKEIQNESPVAMVGDGINDAPALATADIGISMGVSGSALANETGHVILMSNDIRKIPVAVRLARRTRRKIFENIFIAMVTKAAVIALAIAGHPLVWAAVLADMGTCLLVIFNSMLLLRGTTSKTMKNHIRKDAQCVYGLKINDECCDVGAGCGSEVKEKCCDVGGGCGSEVKDKCCDGGVCSSEVKDNCCDMGGGCGSEVKDKCCDGGVCNLEVIKDKCCDVGNGVCGSEVKDKCCDGGVCSSEVKKDKCCDVGSGCGSEVKDYCCDVGGGYGSEVMGGSGGCCSSEVKDKCRDVGGSGGSCDRDEVMQLQGKGKSGCYNDNEIQEVKLVVQPHKANQTIQETKCCKVGKDLESQSCAKKQGECNSSGSYMTGEKLDKIVKNCCRRRGLKRRNTVSGCCKSFAYKCCQFGRLSEIVIE